LKSGDVAPLVDVLVESVRTGLMERYKRAMAAKDFETKNVAAGREYVEAYVSFIHYVEGTYEAAARKLVGHYAEGAVDPHQGH
jgi:hypothetical protein